VERATAHEPVPVSRQLDTTCRDNRFDTVTGSNRSNVKMSPARKPHRSIPVAMSSEH
jgi:hypothetical protein